MNNNEIKESQTDQSIMDIFEKCKYKSEFSNVEIKNGHIIYHSKIYRYQKLYNYVKTEYPECNLRLLSTVIHGIIDIRDKIIEDITKQILQLK